MRFGQQSLKSNSKPLFPGAISAARYLIILSITFLSIGMFSVTAASFFGFVTGAMLTPEEMGDAQTKDADTVALPFDVRYWAALKLARIAKLQPEIVSIGSSRGMELRAAMMAPYIFYNASLTAWTLDQEVTMVDQIARVSKPRVIIVGLDYFMFSDQYTDPMNRERSMSFSNGFLFRVRSCANLLREFWKQPALVRMFFDHWRHGTLPIRSGPVALLGVDAVRGTTGFRPDGSMLLPRGSYDGAPAKLAVNEGVIQAAPGAPRISDRQYQALERLAELGRDRGITLIAVQWPIHHGTIEFLDHNPGYHDLAGVWRQFESTAMRRKMEDLGFVFFDMSRDSIAYNDELFIDAAHPTEFGMSLAVSHLLDQPRFRAILPKIDGERLRTDQASATARGNRFEIYGN
jgi:hypothetical protein